MAFNFFKKKTEPARQPEPVFPQPQTDHAAPEPEPKPEPSPAVRPELKPEPAPSVRPEQKQKQSAVPAGKPERPEQPAKKNSGEPAKQKNPAAAIARKKQLVLDRKALASSGLEALLDALEPALKRPGVLMVPQECLENPDLSCAGRLQSLRDAGYLETESAADFGAYIRKALSRFSGKVCLVLNTPKNRQTAYEICKETGVFAEILSLHDDGRLLNSRERKALQETGRKPREKKPETTRDAFRLCTRPEAIELKQLPAIRQPKAGDIFLDSAGRKILLGQPVMANPTGTSFETDIPGLWAKIYSPESLNTFTLEKAKRMLSKKVEYKGLCWPEDLLRDENGNFAGILVPEARGKALSAAIFKQAGIQTNFPDWTKKDLCDLTITILETVRYLHSRNILLGCLNPKAIRIVSRDEVYFTDTDNYQIEGFPSLVYNNSFTPPEFQGRKVYLAEKKNENYDVAVLTFMLLMPGRTPYYVKPGQKPQDAIQAKVFPFANGKEHHNNKNMPSSWRYMWSHLSPFKQPFYDTFAKGGKYDAPEDRKNADFWLRLVKKFREELDHPYDPDSALLFPPSYKRYPQQEYVRCKVCGHMHPRWYFHDEYFDEYQICDECLHKRSDDHFTCQCCGRTYYYDNKTAILHRRKQKTDHWKKQKYCADCKKKKTVVCPECGKTVPEYRMKNGRCAECNEARRTQVYATKRCKDCGRMFTITLGEHENLASRGMSDPLRCPECRKNRKNRKRW